MMMFTKILQDVERTEMFRGYNKSPPKQVGRSMDRGQDMQMPAVYLYNTIII